MAGVSGDAGTPETFAVAALEKRVGAVLQRAGFNAVQAGALARVVVASEWDGCKSHGLYRLEGMLASASAEPVLLPDDGTGVA